MSTPDHSRNHTARAGHQLHDAVDLPGWEHQSIWGWNEGTGSFYAQLWRNSSSSDAPEIWLTGAQKPYPWPGSIALEIVEHTQAEPLAVVQAMGIAHPEPALRPDQEIGSLVSELIAANDPSPYSMSKMQALAWVLGTAPLSPGTRNAWNCRRHVKTNGGASVR